MLAHASRSTAHASPRTEHTAAPRGPRRGGPPGFVLALQRSAGNRAVTRRLTTGGRRRLLRAFQQPPDVCQLDGVTGAATETDKAGLAGNDYYQDRAWAAGGGSFYVPIVSGKIPPGTPPAALWAKVSAEGTTEALLSGNGVVLADGTAFRSEVEMLNFLVSLFSMSEEDADKLVALHPEELDSYEFFSGLAVIESYGDYKKTVDNLKHQKLPDVGGGEKAKGWKSAGTATASKRIAQQNVGTGLFPGGQYTDHHKISQHRLNHLMDEVDKNPQTARPVTDFIDQMMARTGAQNRRRALLNLPANLEVGPPGDIRIGDPGSGFDRNVTRSGSTTPRSLELEKADIAIQQPNIDFAEVARRLAAAQTEHDRTVPQHELLSQPRTYQWVKKGAKFERQN